MRAGVVWTSRLDERLLQLRAVGLTWDAMAAELGCSRNSVIERGRRLGARRIVMKPARVVPESRDRPPRPPGHPACWGLITAGTLLEGEPYPLPVFL